MTVVASRNRGRRGFGIDADRLHDLGYACFLVDFRGSGGSSGDATTIGYREADDVVRSVALQRGASSLELLAQPPVCVELGLGMCATPLLALGFRGELHRRLRPSLQRPWWH